MSTISNPNGQSTPQLVGAGAYREALAANLPAAQERGRKVRSEHVRRSGTQRTAKPRVLIVEDDPMAQSALYERKLRSSVKVGFGLADSLDIARCMVGCCNDSPFDVIVVDLNLGDDDGAEFVHELLLSSNGEEIVVASAFDEAMVRERLGAVAERVRIFDKSDPQLAERIIELALSKRRALVAVK